MSKTLVLYVFHEITCLVNNFINHAIYESEQIEWLFIGNGCTRPPNLPSFVTFLHRENKGHDFGGWSDAILQHNRRNIYDYYLFANSTIEGPFLEKDEKRQWVEIYLSGLSNNLWLFGSTVNTMQNQKGRPDPYNRIAHVQSYIFIISRSTLALFINEGLFQIEIKKMSKREMINKKEIGMSEIVLNNGGNIGCLVKKFKGVDFREPLLKFEWMKTSDIMFPKYTPSIWKKTEIIFIKGNRFEKINLQQRSRQKKRAARQKKRDTRQKK